MKHNVDIHIVLATASDMEDYHSDPDEAADRINFILHGMYDNADDDIETARLEGLLQYTWAFWHQNGNLLDVEDDDLLDWVDHTLATWDDADTDEIF
ncbi:hypothetical protein DXV75_07775 [Alteromonas aestuariivivens]|uniref:Uncharacterized protein n=1 Tax=Alteromonas aestuariivivens TaxID=1938339 RepID=A0A3D8M817_9ALTE|nr:hypothetical protein [Alteromonas aestuariivivens]RDV25977.1 hypothetical protein DXV75_07775 [Alteromonas aestuariivivens]